MGIMESFTPQNKPPPTDEDLNKLYEEVRRGFQRESPSLLEDVRISAGDDLGSFIDQYRDEPVTTNPPKYEPSNRARVTPSPSLPEKSGFL